MSLKLSNPTPEDDDVFGLAIDLDGDLALVADPLDDAGAGNSGAAYLFDAADGSLRQTFLNPTPGSIDRFGASVALDGGRALIGVPGDDTAGGNFGAAYLFDASDGTLLQTLLPPGPPLAFGTAVALSGDRAVVGVYRDYLPEDDPGAAYVFDATDGSLLHVLSSPSSAGGDQFGGEVAILGDHVFVAETDYEVDGHAAGAVHVFSAVDGSLVRTIPNPTPAEGDLFGWSIAVHGDYVLIGDTRDDVAAEDAGAAYLFDWRDGSLLETFHDPQPNGSSSVSFGADVDLFGDRALIADGGDSTREVAGGASHVFDVATGALVTTLANDPPTAQERFGSFVSLSTDRALISAWRARDEDGLDQVGAAYIFEDLGDQPPLPVDVEAIDSGSYRLDVDGSVDHSPDNENFDSGGRNTGFIVFSLEDLSDPIESGSIDFFKDIGAFASGVEEAYVQSVSFRAFDGDVSLLRAGGNQPDVAAALTTGAEIARADIPYAPDVRDRGGYDVAYPARIASFDAELLADGVAFLNDAIKAGVDEVAIGIVLDALGPGGEIFSQTSRAQGNVALSLGFSEDAPEAADDAVATSEDAPAIIDVLANDAAAGDGSPARDPLSIVTVDGQEIVPGEPVALASGALVTLQPDGRLVYDPNGAFEALGAGAEVLDVFGYEVFDGFASDAAEVSVAVGGANDAPVVQSPVLTIDENSAAGAVVGTPSATDPEDDPLIFAIVGGDVDVDGDGSSPFAIDAASGLITVNDEDDLDFETRQRFELIVRVGDGDLSAEGTVTVEVGDLPDAPGATVLGDDVETGEDGEASGDVATADPPDADATLDAWSSGETEARPDRQSPPLTDDSSSVDPTLEVDGVDHVEGDGDRADAPPSELGSDDPDDAATITAPVESGDDEDAPQRIFGSDASETLRGGNADDRIYGRGERDELRGGRGDDRLYGQEDDDRLLGEAGDDQLHGGVDDDVLSGGAGDDSLFGQFGADRLWGGDGDDMLDGGRGADVMSGGPGDDVYYVDHADDVVDDRGDPDDFDIVMVMQTIRYQLGASVEHAMLDDAGGGGEIVGNRSDNVLSGNAEENALRGRGGHDTLDGARGDDVANGGAGRDLLIGGGGADRLLGRRGGDELVGNQGRDRLDGGRGGDALSGGAGRDVFVQSSGVDLVKDWRDGKDVFEIARGATRFGDLEFERRGDDVLIKTGSGDFRVESVEVGEFDRTDFFFV